MTAVPYVPILLGTLLSEEDLVGLKCHWLELDQISAPLFKDEVSFCRPTTMPGIWNELIGWVPNAAHP